MLRLVTNFDQGQVESTEYVDIDCTQGAMSVIT